MGTTTVSDRLHGIEPSWITGAATIVGALIGGFCLWLANRMMGKAAFQAAINTGFASLLAEVNRDRAELRATIERERVETATERAHLRGEISNLMQSIDSLHAELRRHGIAIPERRAMAGTLSYIELESTHQEHHDQHDHD